MAGRSAGLGNLGLAMFAIIAVACAAFLVTMGSVGGYVAAGAIVALAAGQIAGLLSQRISAGSLAARVGEQGRALRDLADEAKAAGERIARIEQQLTRPEPRAPEDILSEVRALKDSVSNLAGDVAAARQKAEEPLPPKPAPREHLDLLLEPVIDLTAGITAHYRALINMVDEQGREVRHADLMAKADLGGIRPALDHHLLKTAIPVLRRLRLRNPGMRLFVPVGATTLNGEAGVGQLLSLLEINQDTASGLVLDLAQADLGRLDQRGIGELAKLGRMGIMLGLSQVVVDGLELPALRKLGFRYLAIDEAGTGDGVRWKDFSSYARAMQFQIVAGAIATPSQATAAGRIAGFGYGPYFAPPRKVKAEAVRGSPTASSQAA